MAFQNDMLVFLGVKCPKVFSKILSEIAITQYSLQEWFSIRQR